MGMEQQLLSPAPHALQRDRAALPGNVGMGRRAKVDGLQKNSCRLEGRAGQGRAQGPHSAARSATRRAPALIFRVGALSCTFLEMATEGCATSQLLQGGIFPASETCCVHLLLDAGAWEVVFFLSCHGCFGRVPGRHCSVGVHSPISVPKWRGLCAELPTSQQGKPAAQWEPNSLHLFCLSLKHSFLVLTGNNLAGISNWNELFNFYIVDLSCSQAGDLPYILQIGQAKSWCFYKALLGPNLFIFLNYFSHSSADFNADLHRVPGNSLRWKDCISI